jgi:hypothetical protein
MKFGRHAGFLPVWIWVRRDRDVSAHAIRADREDIELTTDVVAGDWIAGVVRRNGRPTGLSNAIYVTDVPCTR